MKATKYVINKTLLDLNLFFGNYVEKYQTLSLEEYGKNSYQYFMNFDFEKTNPSKIINTFVMNKLHDISNRLEIDSRFNRRVPLHAKEVYAVVGEIIFNLKEDEIKIFSELMYLRELIMKLNMEFEDPTIIQDDRNPEIESLFSKLRDDRFNLHGRELFYTLFDFKDQKNLEFIINLHLQIESQMFSKADRVNKALLNQCSLKDKINEILETKKEEKVQIPIYFEKKNTFHELIFWADELDKNVHSFNAKYGYFPNLMLANSLTYTRIDLVANTHQEKIRGQAGDTPDKFVGLTGFHGKDYELDWCVEDKLGDLEYVLIYDSDPNGGLPIPEEINKLKQKVG